MPVEALDAARYILSEFRSPKTQYLPIPRILAHLHASEIVFRLQPEARNRIPSPTRYLFRLSYTARILNIFHKQLRTFCALDAKLKPHFRHKADKSS